MESTKQSLNEAENGNKSKPLLSSRLFRFRAWDTDNNEFVNCEDHQIRQMQTDYGGLGNRFIYSQFIGLVDKNGSEIFEGDIIEYYNTYSKKSYLHIIKWCPMFSGFALFDSVESIWSKESDFLKIIETMEVLGNIFQNPELL